MLNYSKQFIFPLQNTLRLLHVGVSNYMESFGYVDGNCTDEYVDCYRQSFVHSRKLILFGENF